MMTKKTLFSLVPDKKTWLLASTVLLSAGLSDVLKNQHRVSADEQTMEQPSKESAGQFSPTNPTEKKR
ncbi:hypothetical protein [Fructobacillus papyrifericola]|uniref:Uncharacterized protein n=1 Tax=Fructobacillus papyrifericola TaxID=2713172 RepID=A0ABS5QRP3_9LACO|nr:hypothetical protein [Fructobacillus papyrifericola]MBS9335875.1 hypothetical protein [Fructobacillus papyrifericola]